MLYYDTNGRHIRTLYLSLTTRGTNTFNKETVTQVWGPHRQYTLVAAPSPLSKQRHRYVPWLAPWVSAPSQSLSFVSFPWLRDSGSVCLLSGCHAFSRQTPPWQAEAPLGVLLFSEMETVRGSKEKASSACFPSTGLETPGTFYLPAGCVCAMEGTSTAKPDLYKLPLRVVDAGQTLWQGSGKLQTLPWVFVPCVFGKPLANIKANLK